MNLLSASLGMALGLATIIALTACSESGTAPVEEEKVAGGVDSGADNPLFSESSLAYQLPPFDRIENRHFAPAFEAGMEQQAAEIQRIANRDQAPTFDNTLVAMERSGQLLSRVSSVFFNLASAHTNDTLESIRSDITPALSAHRDNIVLNDKLFKRIETLYQGRDQLQLDGESLRLIEQVHTNFVRAGAKLSPRDKERLRQLNTRLATLRTELRQKVLKEVNRLAVVVDSRDELAGMSEAAIAAAAREAEERDLAGKYVIALKNTSGQPLLAVLENRALRQRIMTASLSRGSSAGDFDNREAFVEMIALRAERAGLLGYPTYADYRLENRTAKNPAAVNKLLAELTPAAIGNARREAKALQEMIDREETPFGLQAWDWAYYTEKVRKARFDLDESQLLPYLELENVLQKGVFYAAGQLYGISLKERTDLPVYHPDVRIFEVFDSDGSPRGLFLTDFYARPSKRGGAWANTYVTQSTLFDRLPVVANHLNIQKPPAGQPTLMTFDEVETLFHEFGHALHHLFSDVRYPYFSGTAVPRDFVEFPSQVNEMWATWPAVLENYAVHHQTGEPMPKALLEKVLASQKFNQGHATVEYLAAALLDQAWHQLTPEQVPAAADLLSFESAALKAAGVDMAVIPPRYRTTYFSHVIGGYAAGYYSYIWSEVLDADTVEWFRHQGGLARANGDHFRKTLLSRGGSREAMELFKNFRGAEPDIQPLLNRRGLN